MYPGANNTELVPDALLQRRCRSTAKAASPDAREIARRRETYWRPYHDALARRARAPARRARPRDAAGTATASKAEVPWLFEGRLPDLNLGTAGGASCAPALRAALMAVLARAATLQPRHRRPLQGRLHHAPLRPARASGVHAIQLEMGLATLHGRDARRYAGRRGSRARRALRPVLRDLLQTTLDWRPDGAESTPALLWAPLAWLPDGWRENVLLRAGADGRWARSTADVATRAAGRARARRARCCPASSTRTATPSSAPSPASPSGARRRERRLLVVARAHVRASRCASRPRSCARSRRSSTSSCCAAATRRCASSTTCSATATAATYADPLAMSWALADAAADAGIGLTLLPVLYERAGFAADGAARRSSAASRSSPAEIWSPPAQRRAAAARSSTRGSRSTRCAPRAPASIAR